MMKNPTIILRMTNSCNLNCTYCYDKKNRMNINEENEFIDKNLDKLVTYINKIQSNPNEKSNIIFHGGEPLLIKVDIYEKLIKKLRRNNPNVKFSVQTNATLLNEEFINLFKKYKVNIGISLDGYNEEQNKCRIYKDGKNSFDIVMKKITLLKDMKAKFGIIMTLSKGVLGHEKELYDFIAENEIGCNMRPAFLSDSTDNEYVMSNSEFMKFFINIFEIWYADDKRVKLTQIREIYEEFAKALNPEYVLRSCVASDNCFENFVSLDINGELYSCNRLYNNKDLYYGNINDMTVEELNKKMKELTIRRKENIENSKCKKCLIYNYCYGGCPASAFAKNHDIFTADDYYCEAKVEIYKYLKARLEQTGAINEYETRKNAKK